MTRGWTKKVDCDHCKAKLRLSEFQFYAKELHYKGISGFDTFFRCTKCGKQNCFNGLTEKLRVRLIKQAKEEEKD